MADNHSNVSSRPDGNYLCGMASYLFRPSGGLSPFGQFLAVIPYWMIAVALGYLQWFVALPKLWQKLAKRGSSNERLERTG